MVLKGLILTVSTLGGCCGLERTDFYSLWSSQKNWFLAVPMIGGCGGLEISDFNSFYFERMWWSEKN